MAIQPIKRENVSEQVFKQLKQQLLSGEWKTGDKIPSENELTAAFGVSRVTVRQALQKLLAMGLIETRAGEGSFVKELTPGIYMKDMIPFVYLNKNAINEVMQFRLLMETSVAGIAAEKITAEEIKKLEECYEGMKENIHDVKGFSKYDVAFHIQIGEVTGNSLIIQMYNILYDLLMASVVEITDDVGTGIGLEYHDLIIKTMKDHDVENAKKIMKEHVQEAITTYNRIDKTIEDQEG